METANQVLTALKKLGSQQTRKIHIRHGAPADATFGVKVGDLKKLAKQITGNQQLALDLYATGNSDAMYLAGMMADGTQMTKRQLDAWGKAATWYMLSDYAVAGVAAESPHGRDLALKWMKAKQPLIASAGWSTLSLLLATLPDEQLHRDEITQLIDHAVAEVRTAPGRVAYAMNGFVISVGCYYKPLLHKAKAAAKKIGPLAVDMGETECKVPLAAEYIAKVESMGRIGKKRKTPKCSS